MSLMNVWNNIPDGSKLIVSLNPDFGFGVTGTHTVNTSNGPVLSGAITAAHFPLEIQIDAGDQHIVDFHLMFAGAPADVDVVARVQEPDGSTFQNPSSATVSLDDGNQTFQVTLVANG
jgi:hypothetical protein